MLKQFFSVMGRYLKPYRKYLAWSVVLNFLSQWMNVFSFAVLIPILNILFKIDTAVYLGRGTHSTRTSSSTMPMPMYRS